MEITKKHLSLVLLSTVTFWVICSNVNAETISAINNGDWSSASTWSGNTIPTNLDEVVIPSGLTVTFNVDAACKSLNVQGILTASGTPKLTISGDLTVSGILTIGQNTQAYNATINPGGSLLVSTTGKKLMLGTNGDEATFTNNGTIGTSTKGLYLEIYKSCPKLTLTGTTSIMPYFHSICSDDITSSSYLTGSTQEIIINQNITILNTIGVVNGTSASKGNTRTLTICEGKTVTLSAAAYFHSSYITNGLANNINFNAREYWVYNINGTLDAATNNGKINLQTNLNTSANTINNTLIINIGRNGTMKCGDWVSKREGISTNSISVNVTTGGTITYSGTAYTSNQNPTASTTLLVTNSLLTNSNHHLNFTNTNPVTLNGDITFTGNFAATNLTLEPGSKLTNNGNLNVNTLNISSDATSGTGTFVDNGTSSIALANVQQYLTAGRNWYLSSPVSGATISAFSSASSVVSYNESNANWDNETNLLTPMKGYISVNTLADGPITYSGLLNTGEKTIGLTRTTDVLNTGFNLVGNPYPSYLNWTESTANSANILPTIWYRTKASGDYTLYTYNSAGEGIGSPAEVTSEIPPMQAFWVRVKNDQTTGTLTFNNAMRLHSKVFNTLKSKNTKSSSQQVLRLQVSNGLHNDETVVYFNNNASDNFDIYDSPKMSSNNVDVPEIYTLVDNNELVINGMNAISTNKELALGFTPGTANTFSIKANEISNFNAGTQIILKDLQQNSEQNITEGTSYNFTSDATKTTNRFSLIFKSNSISTDLETDYPESNAISVYKNINGKITVNSGCSISNDGIIVVYNSAGQKIESKTLSNTTTTLDKTYISGVYFITVIINSKLSSHKIII